MVSGLGRASRARDHLTGRRNWHQRKVVVPVVSRSHESRLSSALNGAELVCNIMVYSAQDIIGCFSTQIFLLQDFRN